MIEMNKSNTDSSLTPSWLIAALTAVVLLAGCASAPDGLGPAQIAEATETADERSETVGELVPAQTKVLVQIRPDELNEAIHRLPQGAVPLPDVDDELLELIDGIDAERPVVAALATTGGEGFIERAWMHGMVTGIEELAPGVHLRVLVPAVDAASLVEELASICGEDDGRWMCRPQERGGHVTVDFLLRAPEGVQRAFLDELEAGGEMSNPELFERRTPAFQQFLNTDAPVAAYWSGHHLLDIMLAYWSAVTRADWDFYLSAPSMGGHLDHLLWSYGYMLASLRADPNVAEFEDFAVAADIVELHSADEDEANSSPPEIGFQIDVLRTYTERGLQMWRDGGEAAEASGGDAIVRDAAIPRWATDDGQALRIWLRQLVTSGYHLVEWLHPVLESPGGLVNLIRGDEETRQWFEERLTDVEFELTPADSEAFWRARVDTGDLPGSPFQRLEEHWEAGEGQILTAGYPRDTYEVTRLQLAPGGASWEEPPPVAFDDDIFEAVQPSSESWRGCTGSERVALSQALTALEMAAPEDRRHFLADVIDDGRSGIERCSQDYPERDEQFQSSMGSWYGWKAARNAAFFHLHEARRHAEAGCNRGFEFACAQRTRLAAIDDFSMPPFGRDWHLVGMLPDAEAGLDTFLIGDRGLFDETGLVVDADAFGDAPEDAVAPLVEELDGDAVQLVPDAMADASLVATATDAFAEHGVATHLVAMTGGAFSGAAVVELKPSRDGDAPSFGLHLTDEGVIFFGLDAAVPPIDGCPPDGPTFCLAPEAQQAQVLFERARQHWAEGDVDEAVEIIDGVVDRYRLHEVYNTVDRHRRAAPTVDLHVSVDEGVPAVAAFRLLAALAHERQGAPFEEAERFRSAHVEFDPAHQRFRPLFEDVRLRAERVSAPEGGDGLGRLSEDSSTEESESEALHPADAPLEELVLEDRPDPERPDDLAPELEMDTPETEGALDREIIERVVRQNRRDIQHCYESRLHEDPELEGTLRVEWVISPGGDVVTVSIEESTLEDEEMHRCVVQRIASWKYPEPEGGGIVRVSYPFAFSH